MATESFPDEPRYRHGAPLGHVAVNGILFQCCWFLALLQGWLVALPILFLMLAHYVYTSVDRRWDSRILVGVTSIGILIDALMGAVGVFQFGQTDPVLFVLGIPNWLCVVWLAFALTLNRSLRWLVSKPRWFVIACTVAGPLSYSAGRNLGVVQFSNYAIFFLMLEWFFISLIALYVCSYSKPKASSE